MRASASSEALRQVGASRTKSLTEGYKNNIVQSGHFQRVRSQETLGKSSSAESLRSLRGADEEDTEVGRCRSSDGGLMESRSRRNSQGEETKEWSLNRGRGRRISTSSMASSGTTSRRASLEPEPERDSDAPKSQEDPVQPKKLSASERLRRMRLKAATNPELDFLGESEEDGTKAQPKSKSTPNLNKMFLNVFLSRSPSPPCTPNARGKPSHLRELNPCDSPGVEIGLSRRQILTVLASTAVCTASKDVLTSPFTAPRTSGLSRMDSQSPSPVSSESRMAAEKSTAEQSVAEQSAVEQSAVEQSAAEQEAAIDAERRDVSAMNAGIMAMTTTQILDLAPESTSNAAANLIEEFVEMCDVDGNCVVIKCDEEGCEPCYEEEGCVISEAFLEQMEQERMMVRTPSSLSIMRDLVRDEREQAVAAAEEVVQTYTSKLQQIQDHMHSLTAKLTNSHSAPTSDELFKEINNMKDAMVAHWDQISMETVRGLQSLSGVVASATALEESTVADVVVEKETLQTLVSDNLLSKKSMKDFKKEANHDDLRPGLVKKPGKLIIPRVDSNADPSPVVETTNALMPRLEASLKLHQQPSPDESQRAKQPSMLESVQDMTEMLMTTLTTMNGRDVSTLMTEPMIACGLRLLFQKSAVDQIGDLLGHGIHPLVIGLMVGLGCSMAAKVIAEPIVEGLAGSSRDFNKEMAERKEGGIWSKYFHDVSFSRSFVTCLTQLTVCNGLHTLLADLPPHVELSIQALILGILGGVVSSPIKTAQLKLSTRIHRKLRDKRSTLMTGVLVDVVLFTSFEALRTAAGLEPLNIFEL